MPDIFGSILGGIFGNQNLKWDKNALVNVLNQLTAANQYGTGIFNQFGLPLAANASNIGGGFNQMLFGDQGNNGMLARNNDLFDLAAKLPGQIGGANQIDPQFQQFIDQFGQHAQGFNPLIDIANSIIGNQGTNFWSQAAQNRGYDLMGGNTQQQGALSNTGNQLMANGGLDPYLDTARNVALMNAATGGYNAQLNGLDQWAAKLANTGGVTPGTSSVMAGAAPALQAQFGTPGQTPIGGEAEMSALRGFQGGGANPASNYLLGRGQQLSGGPALLPMSTAYNFARGQAAQDALRQATTAREQNYARTGTPGGPAVAAGNTNAGIQDFQDQALQNEANAGQNALLNQQGLQLQQQGQGLGAVGNSQQLQNQLLNTYGFVLPQLESAATARLGTGGNLTLGANAQENQRLFEALGIVPQAEQLAQNRQFTSAGQGIGAEQAATQRANVGGNQLMDYLNSLGMGANQMYNFLGQDIARLNQGGNLLGTGIQGQQQGGQLGLGGLLSGLGFNLQQGGLLNSIYGNLLGQGNSQAGLGLQGMLSEQDLQSALARAGLGYGGNALSGMPHIFSAFNPTYNPLGVGLEGAFSGLGQGLAALMS